MHFGKKVSETLSKALQHLIAAKNIDIYIVPPDVTIEISFINTNDQSTLSLY
jgi:predicted transcriptional regulator